VPPLVLLLLLGLACYRLTRLVVKDDFPPVAHPRAVLGHWATRAERRRWRWVYDLLDCHWCASGWVALGLVAGVDLLSTVSVPLPALLWPATWAVGAFLNQVEPEK
jgi:hypothetical protein